jgi:holo-[acyl-carrier protein] synthase
MNRSESVVEAASHLVATIGGDMIAALGVDAVSIAEFERDVGIADDTFLAQCFSDAERDYCAGDVEQLATRFALKEAALKALGTGMRGIGLHDVEVETAPTGEPHLRLSPDALIIASDRGLGPLRCSATREAGLALAVVVASPTQSQEDV